MIAYPQETPEIQQTTPAITHPHPTKPMHPLLKSPSTPSPQNPQQAYQAARNPIKPPSIAITHHPGRVLSAVVHINPLRSQHHREAKWRHFKNQTSPSPSVKPIRYHRALRARPSHPLEIWRSRRLMITEYTSRCAAPMVPLYSAGSVDCLARGVFRGPATPHCAGTNHERVQHGIGDIWEARVDRGVHCLALRLLQRDHCRGWSCMTSVHRWHGPRCCSFWLWVDQDAREGGKLWASSESYGVRRFCGSCQRWCGVWERKGGGYHGNGGLSCAGKDWMIEGG